MDPFLFGAVPLRVAPDGPNHVLFTITVLSTDGSNWILQVRVTLLPIETTGLERVAMIVAFGVGTGDVSWKH